MALLDDLPLPQPGAWHRAHTSGCQADTARPGSWLHGLVQTVAPDEDNSRYW